MQKTFAALQWSIFAASTIASPVVVPLEVLTVEGVDQYLIPAKLGSTKQSVLILPWGAGPSYDRYVVDLLDDTFCPQADPNVPEEICENYYGGLFNVEESTTYKPDDDDDTSSSDLLYGVDSLEMGGVTLSNVGVNVWGVRDDGNTSYQGGRPRLSYSNGSTIWEALSSTPDFNSRSVASFAGAIEAQGNATLTTGQYPGSLIFGGYDKKLFQGPVLSAAMQKPSSSDDIAYSSPRFRVTSLVYRHPVSGNESNLTTVWSNDEGFEMYIETQSPLSVFYDTLYLPSSAIDLLAGAVGAEKRPGSSSDIYAEDLYILSDDQTCNQYSIFNITSY